MSSSSYKPVDMFEKIVMTNVLLGVRSSLGAVESHPRKMELRSINFDVYSG